MSSSNPLESSPLLGAFARNSVSPIKVASVTLTDAQLLASAGPYTILAGIPNQIAIPVMVWFGGNVTNFGGVARTMTVRYIGVAASMLLVNGQSSWSVAGRRSGLFPPAFNVQDATVKAGLGFEALFSGVAGAGFATADGFHVAVAYWTLPASV